MRTRYFDDQWAFIQSVNARMQEILDVYRRTPIEDIQTLKRRLENSNIHREPTIYRCNGCREFNDLDFELTLIDDNLNRRTTNGRISVL